MPGQTVLQSQMERVVRVYGYMKLLLLLLSVEWNSFLENNVLCRYNVLYA